MARSRRVITRPTDDEIMSYTNVPVSVAAKYIGWSSPTLYRALQRDEEDERSRIPFGFAARTHSGVWTYNITPHALVNYRHKGISIIDDAVLRNIVTECVDRIVNDKLAAIVSQLPPAQ